MIDRKTFFDLVRADLFSGFLSGSQVSGILAVLDVWDKTGFDDSRWLAYCLATNFHETGKAMVGIREWGEGKGQKYGIAVPPYGLAYYGRGMVQLTWLANYEAASKHLAVHDITVDLAKSPDDALSLDTAAAVLVFGMAEGWFTGQSLPRWFSATINDPVNARRIVNGQDRASDIAGYHAKFLTAINAATSAPVAANDAIKIDVSKPVLAGIETAINKDARPAPPAQPGFLARLRAWFNRGEA